MLGWKVPLSAALPTSGWSKPEARSGRWRRRVGQRREFETWRSVFACCPPVVRLVRDGAFSCSDVENRRTLAGFTKTTRKAIPAARGASRMPFGLPKLSARVPCLCKLLRAFRLHRRTLPGDARRPGDPSQREPQAIAVHEGGSHCSSSGFSRFSACEGAPVLHWMSHPLRARELKPHDCGFVRTANARESKLGEAMHLVPVDAKPRRRHEIKRIEICLLDLHSCVQ